jgi:hypothetical protein
MLTFADESYTYVVLDSLLDNVRLTTQSSQAPLVTAQPARTFAVQGGSATFSVGASGIGLSYQWQFGGSNITGATGSAYTVTGGARAKVSTYRWQPHCRGLYQTPIAA